MKAPKAPVIDARRKREFSEELRERARVWMPTWAFDDVEGDFGKALLEIAARFDSEVAERLDQSGEKMRRGFLDWLGVQGEAARPARMPVVFKLADTAQEAVFAAPPVRMQVEAGGTPVIFETETETDLRLVPGRIDMVVGVDADKDAIYLPPPGLSDLKPLEPLPVEWKLKSFASAGTVKLQLEPDAGLSKGMTIAAGGRHYRIEEADNGIVTIDPPLEADLDESTVSKVAAFAPFDGVTRNRQEHALYIGDDDLLNIEAAAVIEVGGARVLNTGVKWQYWGKTALKEEVPDWRDLTISDTQNAAGLLLEKAEGAVEPRKIGEVTSRWIRAISINVGTPPALFEADSLRLKVNCDPDPKCSMPDPDLKGVAVEAMANTTPLVIDKPFFPLGRLPRQFDAFYLGSEEAFSKTGATAKLSIMLSDRSFTRLSAVRQGLFANTTIAGVAKDRSLHLLSINTTSGVLTNFRGRGPLQPPSPKYLSGEEKGGRIALDLQPAWQLPVWPEDAAAPLSGFLVGTTSRDRVWIWREHPISPTNSGWIEFGSLPVDGSPPNAAAQGLIYLGGPQETLVALYDQRMFISGWSSISPSAAWTEVSTKDGNQLIRLVSIVPILVDDGTGRLATSSAEGMIGISDQGELFRVGTDGACTPITKFSSYIFDPTIHPVAIKIAGSTSIAGATEPTNADPQLIVAHNGGIGSVKEIPFENGSEVVPSLEGLSIGGVFHVMATVKDNAEIRLTTWAPYAVPPFEEVFNSRIGSAGTIVDPGAPLSIGSFVVVPAGRADILTSKFDPTTGRFQRTDTMEHGFLANDTPPLLATGDLVVRFDPAGEPHSREIVNIVSIEGGQVLYKIDSAFSTPANLTEPDVYDMSEDFNCTLSGTDLTLDAADDKTDVGDYLFIDDDLYKVTLITPSGSDLIASMEIPNTAGNSPNPATNDYVRGVPTDGRVVPFMTLVTSGGGSGDWDARLLNRIHLVFPDGTPQEQNAIAFQVTPAHKPQIIYLKREFETVPSNPADFVIDAAFSDWIKNAGDTSTNAELSWEYWNGKGWSKLDLTHDDTENLKTNGTICFMVPSDISASDWAGKTNYWIRARLIEGDYGQEEVKVVTSGNEQTVKRSTDNVKAPQVLSLSTLYSICKDLLPKYVLSKDNETIVDQSDANNTPGAIVEGFLPVGLVLERLSREAPGGEGGAHDCPPECECQNCSGSDDTGQTAPEPASDADAVEDHDCPPECECHDCSDGPHTAEAPQTAPAAPLGDSAPQAGRSLFIGLDAKVSAGTASILLMVDKEAQHLDFAPMRIESLVGGKFKQLVVDDATRALGESGVLLLSFAVAPTLSTLFGKTLIWLRLTPKAPGERWVPSIKGAYLNAAFASSKETLTRELLGSSDGSPGLTLSLARPPVLRDTLELRVLEPLGEEERKELAGAGSDSVLSEVDGLPGDWVLWRKVTDTGDEAAGSRAYTLDETTGEVRFGNGKHGRIPPIGRNNIVAFGYSRTEAGQPGSDAFPANAVTARTALNLVSPVESVESVIAADHAAGGSPPESDDRVLRSGFARFRHRGRAVTINDLEDLALESSPDIAQARVFSVPGGVRLVVIMKGKVPAPSAAQARELHRLLLDASPVSLSAPRALRIEGPGIRRLRIELTLGVERLEHASQISKWVNTEIARFFSTSLGGVDGRGWPLGLRASEDDIAFVLSDAPLLSGIRSIKCLESRPGGREVDWPSSIKPTEIVMLDEDPVRIRFETAEVQV